MAAAQGSMKGTIALLSRGSINIDQGDPKGFTALILAAQAGRSRVVRILLNRGADVSIAMDGGGTLCTSCIRSNGHLAVTVDLVKAGGRTLLWVEAVHAVLWLWVRESLPVSDASEVSTRTSGKTPASGTPLTSMLPIDVEAQETWCTVVGPNQVFEPSLIHSGCRGIEL